MSAEKSYPSEAPPPYPGNPNVMPAPSGPPGQYGPPGPPGPPGAPGYPATTVNVNMVPPTPQMMIIPRVPMTIRCQQCGATVTTNLTFRNGDATWRAAFILCCLAGVIGCAIAFCMDSTQDAVHTCPNCNTEVAVSEGTFC